MIVDSVDYSEAIFSSMDSCLQTCMSLNDDNDFLYPRSYNLHNNYPNPFNPFTTIRYDLPEASLVRVTVYDMLGNVINSILLGSISHLDINQYNGMPLITKVIMYQQECISTALKQEISDKLKNDITKVELFFKHKT